MKDVESLADDLLIDAADEEDIRAARTRNVARVRLLWSKRHFLFRATLCGLLIAALIAFIIPKRYQATATLMPPSDSSAAGASIMGMVAAFSGGSADGDGLASMAGRALGVQTPGSLFVGILGSETVQDRLIQKFNLQKVYGTRYVEDARKALAKHTAVAEDSKTGMITISVTDHDPKQAAAMAQEYVTQLDWVVTHLSTSSARREREFLEERLKQVTSDLGNSEKRFGEFASQKGAIDIDEQGKAMLTAAANLQGQLIAAESELKALKETYTDSSVRVRSARAQVDELRRQLEKIGGKGTTKESSAADMYPSIRELPILGVTYADLFRKTKVQQAVFLALSQQLELAKVREAREVPSVTVLDPPLIPQKKSYPPRLMIIALGALVAFTSAVLYLVAVSAWERVDVTDERKQLAIEIYATAHDAISRRMPNKGPFRWLRTGSSRSSDQSSVLPPE